MMSSDRVRIFPTTFPVPGRNGMDALVGGEARWSRPIPIELALVALPILFARRLSGRRTLEVLDVVADRFRPRSPFFRAYPRGFSHVMFVHDLVSILCWCCLTAPRESGKSIKH